MFPVAALAPLIGELAKIFDFLTERLCRRISALHPLRWERVKTLPYGEIRTYMAGCPAVVRIIP